MNEQFQAWVAANGLCHVFTTNAGDSFYANPEKRFGVLQKNGEPGATSFYLDDVVEFVVRDDENTLVQWSAYSGWQTHPRSTRHSTNEVYMRVRLQNGMELKFHFFRGTLGNVTRTSQDHVNLCNYAYQLAQIFLASIQ